MKYDRIIGHTPEYAANYPFAPYFHPPDLYRYLCIHRHLHLHLNSNSNSMLHPQHHEHPWFYRRHPYSTPITRYFRFLPSPSSLLHFTENVKTNSKSPKIISKK